MLFGKDGKLISKVQAYFDKQMLETVAQRTIYDKFATIMKQLPDKNGKTVSFKKFIPMEDIIFAQNINKDFVENYQEGQNIFKTLPEDAYKDFILPEGSSGTSKGSLKAIEYTIEGITIGDWLPYTEELVKYHDLFDLEEVIKQMGGVAARVVDSYYRDLYAKSAGHIVTHNDITDAGLEEKLINLTTALYLSGAEPVREVIGASAMYNTVPVYLEFVAYGHRVAIDKLAKNPKFVPVEKYADALNGKILDGERGKLGTIRFVQEPNATLISNGGSSYTAKFVVHGGDHTAQVPIRMLATEKRTVYKGMEVVANPIGSGGTNDALHRVGSIGWKGTILAGTLYPERLAVLELDFNY